MMKFKLTALHVPSQETVTYGPWEAPEDLGQATWMEGYAHGFLGGLAAGNGAEPGDLTNFEVTHVDGSTE